MNRPLPDSSVKLSMTNFAQPEKLEMETDISDLGLNPGNNMVLAFSHVPPIFFSVGSTKAHKQIGPPFSFSFLNFNLSISKSKPDQTY